MKVPNIISQEVGSERPWIVGIGGTMRAGSSSEAALRFALSAAEKLGARTEIFAGPDLNLPLYAPELPKRSAEAGLLVAALRRCDGIIVSSPGYHGSISGLVKNALDYVEDMRGDSRVYFEGRAVGCIVCAQGWQATGSTLAALRSVVHSLRGWPTPLGVTINSSETRFNPDGSCPNQKIESALVEMAAQVMSFAGKRPARNVMTTVAIDNLRKEREAVCAADR